ncbi:MAG: carbon-nitrogen hydrolase family protein [Candidatus Hodarchaeales archaeon]|jgi:predicted amidohydrolase
MINSPNKLLITVLQPKLKLNDVEYNLKQYSSLFESFEDDINSPQVICFPEYWNGIRKDNYEDSSQDEAQVFLRAAATRFNSWIIGGSHLVNEKGSFRNRSHIYSPSGKLIGTYDKRRLFGYERYQGILAGKDNCFFKVDKWKASIRICNDLWNTQDYSMLLRENLDIIFSPILTSLPDKSYTNYGRYLWHNLAVIRSKEAAAAVVVSDPAIQPIKEPYWCAGASCIADPSWRFNNQDPIGKNILTTIPDGKEGIIIKELDLEAIKKQKTYRKKMGLLTEN